MNMNFDGSYRDRRGRRATGRAAFRISTGWKVALVLATLWGPLVERLFVERRATQETFPVGPFTDDPDDKYRPQGIVWDPPIRPRPTPKPRPAPVVWRPGIAEPVVDLHLQHWNPDLSTAVEVSSTVIYLGDALREEKLILAMAKLEAQLGDHPQCIRCKGLIEPVLARGADFLDHVKDAKKKKNDNERKFRNRVTKWFLATPRFVVELVGAARGVKEVIPR